MGQNESTFRKTYAETVSELSSVQLSEIHARFAELYAEAGGSKGVVVDREAFSKYLNLPVTVGDRLFDAFDKKKNGSICMEEFVCGLAIVLHGSFKDRCALLFSVFNLGNDEGVSREELRTMLTAIMQSTNTILYSVGDQDSAVMGSEDIQTTVDAMVQTAFTNCDISRTGKLLPMEFEYWLKRNPKVLDSLLSFQTRTEECTLGKLILSPSEQVIAGMTTPVSSLPSQQGSPAASPSQQQKRRSPFLSRGQSKKGKESQSPASSLVSKMFQVGSEDSISTQESGMGSVNSSVLQSVNMDTDRRGLASQQDSLTSVGSGLQFGVSTEAMKGSLTSLDVSDIPRVPPTSTDVSLSDHRGDQQLVGIDGKSGYGTECSSVQSAVSLQVEVESSFERSRLLEESLITPPTREAAVDAGAPTALSSSTSIPGEQGGEAKASQGNNAAASDQVALEFDGVVGTGLSQVQASPGEQSYGMEGTGCYEGNVVYEGVDMGGGAGSIMNADSSLALDMDGVMQEQASGSDPLSPILPTTALEVGVEEVEQGAEQHTAMVDVQEVAVAAEPGEEVAVERMAQVTLSHQNSGQDSTVQKPPPTFSQLDEPLLKSPLGLPQRERMGRVSPLVDEWAGQEVREDVHEAWVLNADTRAQLDTTDSANLTCPALMADIKLSDGISDLLRQHYPDRPRMQLLTMDQVSMDAAGLRRLVSSGSLFSALEMTAHFLSAHGQGLGQVGQPTIHTHKTLQMWSARISLLLFLKLYNEAERELDAFGEMTNPDLYYEYHGKAYPGRKGSMVPFTLRLMHANLPRHTGKVQLALDRLCTLQHTCQQILAVIQNSKCLPGHEALLCEADIQVAVKVWQERLCRVKCCLANTLVHLQDYAAASKVYNELVKEDEENKCELLSLIGRLYLQLGDLKTAQSYFEKVKVHLADKADSSSIVHLNNGFASVCLSQWQTAMDHFNTALALDPGDLSTQSNITVCKFYMGQLKESIRDMESLLTVGLPMSLQPAVFANLANSYELESGDSFNKKISFLPLLGQHVGQGYQHLPLLSLRS